MVVQIGAWDSRPVEVGPRHAVRGEAMRFDTVALALQFLRRAVDPGDLLRLRALLVAQHPAIGRSDDDALLRRVAEALDAGTLVAVLCRAPTHAAAAGAQQPARPALPAPRPRVAAPPEPVAAPDEPAPIAAWEPVAQAATLKRAARHGTPFCEICQAAGHR